MAYIGLSLLIVASVAPPFASAALLPDLIVIDVHWTPSAPGVGSAVTFTAWVKNQGTTPAANFVVRFLVDNTTNIGDRTITTLAAGASTNVTSDAWTATDGAHTVKAIADATNVVVEDNEGNNERWETVQVRKADLVPLDIVWTPPAPGHGQSTTFTVSIKNQGQGQAVASTVRFLLDNTTNLGDKAVGILNAGATTNVSSNAWTAVGGTHTIKAIADVTGQVTEADETNNNRTETVTVTKPDLAVRDISWSPSAPGVGSSVTFTAWVQNEAASASAGAFKVRFLLDNTTNLGDRDVSGLNGHQGANVTSDAWVAVNGAHSIRAVADVLQQVDESNEANNNRTETVSVGKADLVVEDVRWSPASPSGGDATTFTAQVRNAGTSQAIASTLRFLLDGTTNLGDVATPLLAPGARANVTSNAWTAVPGTHAIAAIADINNAVTEANEVNNNRTESVFVQGPDLVAWDVSWSPSPPQQGDAVTFTGTVRNFGTQSAGTFAVRFLVDGTQVGADKTVSGLAPNAWANVTSDAWTAIAGTHSVEIVADANHVVAETNEANNNRTESFTVVQPDLIVQSLWTTPANPAAGQPMNFTAVVKNQGNGTAGPFHMRFYLDGVQLGADQYKSNNTAPGGTASFTVTWSNPTLGNHTIRAVADVLAEVAESDETNNERTTAFHVGQPDLLAYDVTWSPSSPAQGNNVFFTVWLYNVGDADAYGFAIRYYVDGVQIGAFTDQSVTIGGPWGWQSPAWTAVGGQHQIRVVLDADGQLAESNEANNELTETFSVKQPDLIVPDIASSPTSPSAGQSTTFTAQVKNQGNASATTFKVRFFVDGTQIGADKTVSSLAAGAQTNVTSDAWTAVIGNHTIRAFADALGQVAESNEANNNRTESFTVAQADLIVDAISKSPTSPEVGTSTTFIATVRNQGQGDAVSFKVRFLVDGTQVGSDKTVSSLAAGASVNVNSDAWVATSGSHTVKAIADVLGQVDETNETNNETSVSFTVPQRGVDLSPNAQSATVLPAGSKVYKITVTNTGDATDTIDLTRSAPPTGWSASLSVSSVTLAAGASQEVTLTVTAPLSTSGSATINVTGKSHPLPSVADTVSTTTTIGL